jgi:hypothetical protein
MKKLNSVNLLFALFVLWSALAISGCKKEAIVKPVATLSATAEQVDSANYLRGYLGDEPVKFEGSIVSYNAYVDPDSAMHHNGNGNSDYDSYYLSGSKWVTISGGGLPASSASGNASVEIRSLAVRVFVTPISATSTNYYNLLGLATYPFADGDDTNAGAYVSLHDSNGVLWTSLGEQNGSTLTITSRGANMNTYTVVSGTISCKMYDSVGNMKLLTGAKFTAALGI